MRQAVNLQNTKSFGNKATKGFTQLQGKVREILGRNLVRVTEYTSNLEALKVGQGEQTGRNLNL